MSSSIYINSKNVFLDTVNSKDYVQLDRVSTIYQALKDEARAEQSFNKTIYLDPNHHEALYHLALIMEERG
ncbi:MAG: hypothetical protein ABFQ64_07730, partial [Campylobacterota bacterium]